MRKTTLTFISQRGLVFAIVFGLLGVFGFSQENEASGGDDLVNKLNLSIAKIHSPKFKKTPSSQGESVEESDLNYKYYDSSDEWMEVSFRYALEDFTPETESKPTKEEKKLNPIVPEVTFKIFIEGKSKAGGKNGEISVLLTGEATYLHIKKTDTSSKFRYGIFFVSPELVEQYDLKELFGSPKGNIRVEAYIGDKKAVKGKNADESYMDLKEKDPTWDADFKGMKQIKDVVLNKNMTPWVNASADRFPLLKLNSPEKK
jgi:hypothetical protein